MEGTKEIEALFAKIEQQSLGIEYVDIFYSHRPDPDTPLEETMAALSQAVRVPLQLFTFLGKVALLCVIQIQIRWTLPRFRYDQMLGLSWKILLPISLANLVVTVLWMWLVGGGQ